MIIKTTIALAAALLLGVATTAVAGDNEGHERQSEGYAFHTGPLGQPLSGSGAYAYAPFGAYAYAPYGYRAYAYMPRRHHRMY